MSIEDLVFAQFRGSLRSENSLYIHSSGTQAIVIDGALGAGRDAAEEFCYEWLKENEALRQFDPFVLTERLHESLKSMELRASMAIVTQVDDEFQFASVGEYFIHEVHPNQDLSQVISFQRSGYLGASRLARPEFSKLPLDRNLAYVLCTPDLDRRKLRQSPIEFDAVKGGDLEEQLSSLSQSDEWTALAFPIGGITDFDNPNWPYYPFVGIQEELPHERLGLSLIADALFKSPEFRGFKILEAPHIIEKNHSRMLDALLVSPYGVFPLELKHYFGEMELLLGRDKDGLRRNGRAGWRTERNPEMKLRKTLPVFRSPGWTHPLNSLPYEHRKDGILVFTRENAEITCIAQDGRRNSLPHKEGDIIICNPSNIARALLQGNRRKARDLSSPQKIEALIRRLMNRADITETPQQPTDAFQVDFGNKLERESTGYFVAYSGTHEGDDIWVKEYKHTVLSGLSQEEEFGRIGREVSILQRLNRHRIPGVRYIYGRETIGNAFYVFLEPAYSMNLEEWLRTAPIRSDRIEMLKSIASILRFIGGLEEPVIHRAVNPRNIRIGKTGEYQLINFELSQRESLATLPLNARRTFDEMYQAPEMSEHGKQLTPAADVYSFMLCTYFTLAEELPFARSSNELANLSHRSDFWPRQVEKLGLPQTESGLWKRALNINARYRPTMDEIMNALVTWS